MSIQYKHDDNFKIFLYKKYKIFYKSHKLRTYSSFLNDGDIYYQMYLIYGELYKKNILRKLKLERILK